MDKEWNFSWCEEKWLHHAYKQISGRCLNPCWYLFFKPVILVLMFWKLTALDTFYYLHSFHIPNGKLSLPLADFLKVTFVQILLWKNVNSSIMSFLKLSEEIQIPVPKLRVALVSIVGSRTFKSEYSGSVCLGPVFSLASFSEYKLKRSTTWKTPGVHCFQPTLLFSPSVNPKKKMETGNWGNRAFSPLRTRRSVVLWCKFQHPQCTCLWNF